MQGYIYGFVAKMCWANFWLFVLLGSGKKIMIFMIIFTTISCTPGTSTVEHFTAVCYTSV